MQPKTRSLDPRWFQIVFQSLFLCYGLFALHWAPDAGHYAVSIGGCLAFTYLAECIRQNRLANVFSDKNLRSSAFSVLISAASLCLLLKTNHWAVSLIAALLTVASKYLLRIGGKHIFNPSAFGIIATILLTGKAWLSPGQWGNHTVMLFAIITLGTIVVTRVQKLDVSLAFLITFAGLIFWRQVLVLHWPMDYFIHSVSTGGLLLFTFFMISDPRTSPNHPLARIVWAVLIAIAAFYLSAFKFANSTPVWVLVFAAPLVPLLDAFFKKDAFQWKASPVVLQRLRNPLAARLSGIFVLLVFVGYEAAAFCGFYVSKADGTLKNKTSQVIMVRDGNKSVITMYNDFKGDSKDFAMVVPVPVVLKKSDIKVVDQQIFKTLNEYSQPRLVEYFDENPCTPKIMYDMAVAAPTTRMYLSGARSFTDKTVADKVHIEARYLVGEYDILILSATESSALKTWLSDNGYKIPPNANEVLEPYIKSNLKFFVVKVNEAEKAKLAGNFLRPLQITFSSPKFMLPIRLGMANADGDQDLLVYAFTRRGRVELTNYRSLSMPTGRQVPLFVKDNFSAFYANTFKQAWQREGKSIGMLEYAWDVSPRNYMKCDPCVGTAPSQQDLVQAGVWWMGGRAGYADGDEENGADNGAVFFTRMHLRYNRASFPQDLMFQLTPNNEAYQARYVITHPATGDLDCDAGKAYKKTLRQRRRDEIANLQWLTGKSLDDWDMAMINDEEKALPGDASYKGVAAELKQENGRGELPYVAGLSGAMVAAVCLGVVRRKRVQ